MPTFATSRWPKAIAIVVLALPAARTGVELATKTIGADPVAITLNRLGFWTLTFLVASLVPTPARIVLGLTWPLRLRRIIGVGAFCYAAAHFVMYLAVDQELVLADIVADVVKRKFMAVGFFAFLLLVPLALTSTDGMVRRLGFARWKRLHRLVYVAAAAGVVHFLWRVKADLRAPLVFGFVLCALLFTRLAAWVVRSRRV
jgi:sulfoxide reductase heme-binding subunit YedZ